MVATTTNACNNRRRFSKREDIFDYLVDDGGEGLVATRVGLESGLEPLPFRHVNVRNKKEKKNFYE